jgi:hypothetical protein
MCIYTINRGKRRSFKMRDFLGISSYQYLLGRNPVIRILLLVNENEK